MGLSSRDGDVDPATRLREGVARIFDRVAGPTPVCSRSEHQSGARPTACVARGDSPHAELRPGPTNPRKLPRVGCTQPGGCRDESQSTSVAQSADRQPSRRAQSGPQGMSVHRVRPSAACPLVCCEQHYRNVFDPAQVAQSPGATCASRRQGRFVAADHGSSHRHGSALTEHWKQADARGTRKVASRQVAERRRRAERRAPPTDKGSVAPPRRVAPTP